MAIELKENWRDDWYISHQFRNVYLFTNKVNHDEVPFQADSEQGAWDELYMSLTSESSVSTDYEEYLKLCEMEN